MADEKEQIKTMVKKLKGYSGELAATMKITDETNKQGQEKYIALNGLKSRVDAVTDFCIDAQNNSNKIEDQDIIKIKFAVDSVMQSSPTVTLVAEESKQVNAQVIAQIGTINATIPIVASGATWLSDYSIEHPDIFPNRNNIIEKYKIKNELDTNITYINSQLPDVKKYVEKCDISKEFERFIRTFQSNPPAEEKYQHLSSCRAMLFGRLILRYQWRKFGKPKDHREAITNFITNGKKLDSIDENIVKDFMGLYEELSQKDPSKPSIKKGRNISAEYNEQLFGKIIAYLAAILKLREKYHS